MYLSMLSYFALLTPIIYIYLSMLLFIYLSFFIYMSLLFAKIGGPRKIKE